MKIKYKLKIYPEGWEVEEVEKEYCCKYMEEICSHSSFKSVGIGIHTDWLTEDDPVHGVRFGIFYHDDVRISIPNCPSCFEPVELIEKKRVYMVQKYKEVVYKSSYWEECEKESDMDVMKIPCGRCKKPFFKERLQSCHYCDVWLCNECNLPHYSECERCN